MARSHASGDATVEFVYARPLAMSNLALVGQKPQLSKPATFDCQPKGSLKHPRGTVDGAACRTTAKLASIHALSLALAAAEQIWLLQNGRNHKSKRHQP